MTILVIDSALRLLEAVFGYEAGDSLFNISVGLCVLAWILVARVFMAMFSTKRGIIAAFFALIVPLMIGLLAYAMAELHMVPRVDAVWAPAVLPWVGFGLFVLASVLVFSKRILDLSAGVTVFVCLVATAAAIGMHFATQITMGVIEYGEEQVEQREQRVNEGLDSLLQGLPRSPL